MGLLWYDSMWPWPFLRIFPRAWVPKMFCSQCPKVQQLMGILLFLLSSMLPMFLKRGCTNLSSTSSIYSQLNVFRGYSVLSAINPLSYISQGIISQGIILLPELQMEVHLIIMYLIIITTDTLTFHFGLEDWPSCTVYYLFSISSLIFVAWKNSISKFSNSLCAWQIIF